MYYDPTVSTLQHSFDVILKRGSIGLPEGSHKFDIFAHFRDVQDSFVAGGQGAFNSIQTCV